MLVVKNALPTHINNPETNMYKPIRRNNLKLFS
ncbi:hypothetical protein GGQ73_001762 [Rhizobium skierniewicense]|uniref:Uncharacterized protein n=1 Tax=Rhizobium skierniewicense TaxID=984260 RepID=A0A7W6C9T4_9HYPH|nr:hypothetical protein [Rhizobium skierniewicense]